MDSSSIEVNYQVYDNLGQVPKLDPNLPTFCDIESEQLYVDARIIQLYQPQSADHVIILDFDEINEADIKAFIKPLWTVWWNASYDFGTLNMTTVKFDDLQYIVKTAYPLFGGTEKFSLDNVIAKFGFDLYKDLDKKDMQKSGFMRGVYLSHTQLLYASTDVIALSLMWEKEPVQLVREHNLAYKVDILSLEYSIEYQQNGLLVDQKSVAIELGKCQEDIRQNEKVLDVEIPNTWLGEGDTPEWWPKGNFKDLRGINSNSWKQVRAVLRSRTSDKPALINIIAENSWRSSIAKAIFDQRRLIKRKGFLESYNYPKVYTRYNPAGAITGRFTATGGDLYNGINAQQITRNLQYIFNKDTEDTIVIEADFGTAELRAAASIMQDETMYKELMDGIDLHKVSAALATGISIDDITKDERTKGKAVSFGLIFGMSASTFQEYAFVNYDVVFTLEECKAIKKAYQEHYPSIKKYHEAAWNNIKKNNYIVSTALGRRARPKIGTDAINIPTQGTIAETTKLAIHYAVKEDRRILQLIYNIVHDQINLRVPRAEVDYWRELLVRNMKQAWTEICKTPLMHYKDIPMPVDAEHSAA